MSEALNGLSCEAFFLSSINYHLSSFPRQRLTIFTAEMQRKEVEEEALPLVREERRGIFAGAKIGFHATGQKGQRCKGNSLSLMRVAR